MGLFVQHTEDTAPSAAKEVLGTVKERYGFIPNLAAYVAESPIVLETIMSMAGAFDKTSLTAREQQLVLLTVSALNGCAYCKTVHTALGKAAEIDAETLQAIVAFEPLEDHKLTALRDFTRKLVEEKGWLKEQDVQQFLEAGYTQAHVFEVILGIAMKTLTNYSNHLAGAEPNEEFIAMVKGKAAA